jgi:tetratricopeptide (TPR) repeat protein
MGKVDDQLMGAADTIAPEKDKPKEAVALPVKQFGRYLVLERLGAGGMGVVYRAFDPQLDRKVAIKILRGGGGEEAHARLLREAQAMARLSHPNVIAVHDVGVLDDQVFVAMELIEGPTLGRWLNDQRRSWREALAKLIPAGRGLAAAHAAGLVHRDFKPANVLVDERGRVCVTDFGLARSAEEVEEPASLDPSEAISLNILSSPLTRTGALLGTPAYMAPEQLRRQPTTPRTDQFSFCVTAYEAVYGERPFAGDTIEELTTNLSAHKLREPPPRSDVPKWLRNALMRGLNDHPSDRHPSMEALLAELERDPGAQRRQRLVGAGIFAVVAAGVLAVAGVTRHETQLCRGAETKLQGVWDPSRRAALTAVFDATHAPYAADAARGTIAALDEYARRWVGMHVAACEATRVRGEQSEQLLDLRMACLSQRKESMGALVELFLHADAALVGRAVGAAQHLSDLDACQDAAALKSPLRPPADPADRARAEVVRRRIASARALTEAGRYADAIREATPTVAAAEALADRPLQAEALFNLALAEGANGEFKAAEKHYVDAALAADAGHDDTLMASAWTGLTRLVGYEEQHYDDGLSWARYARAQLERIGGNPRIEAQLLVSVGTIYAEQGKPDLAQPEHERALALQEKILGPASTEVAKTLLDLGYDYFARGQWDQALAVYQRSLDIRERVLGPAHPQYATSLINVGNVYYQRRELDRAAECYQRALGIQERALGPEHPLVAASLNNLGNVYSDGKKWDQAADAYRRALAIEERAHGPDHPSLEAPIGNLGDVYLGQGKIDLALAQYQRALAILTKARGKDHPSLARPLIGVGECYLKSGPPAKAVAPLERALALRLANPGDPLELAMARFDVARAVAATQRARAHDLALLAQAAFAAAGASRQAETAEVDAWLARNR